MDQVRQALAAGAAAVQMDSAVWVEPGLPGQLVARVAAKGRGTTDSRLSCIRDAAS